jgi:xanthine dehydrogenase accessory factor
VVLATVIRLDGKPPSHPGAKILLSRTAALAGTLGCSEFDSAALADAGRIADAGAPELRTYSHDLGSIEVYLEPYPAAPTLVVFAATPVAASLLRWAPDLSGALGQDVYVVHTDHDAEDLVQALEAVLPTEPRFIGLVGSRRHTGHHLEALRAKGVAEEVIAKIQSPVGLDIGAQTPGEIALSILAGIVAVRREDRIRKR